MILTWASPFNILHYISANTGRSPNAGTILAHRLRRWPNIVPALCERIVFAEICIKYMQGVFINLQCEWKEEEIYVCGFWLLTSIVAEFTRITAWNVVGLPATQ